MSRLLVLLLLVWLGLGSATAAPALRLSAKLAPQLAAPLADATLQPLSLQLTNNAQASIDTLVLDKAMAMLGTEYELGRNDEEAVDCSGLVQQVFRSAGLKLPRTSRELLASGTAVRRTSLRPGDLLIYRWKARRLHVAVYVHDGYIVHASPSAGEVVMTELNYRWQQKLVAVRRLL